MKCNISFFFTTFYDMIFIYYQIKLGDKMKLAICDDDCQELQYISGLMDEYSSRGSAQEKIEFHMELMSYIERGIYFDIFLLDIIMPIINGIELATEIRKKNHVAKIIFLTSSPEFAVDSYSVGAFNYLLKPTQKDKLFSVLDKAGSEICRQPQQSIVVKTQTCLIKVFLHEIVYVEVIGRTLYFHQKNGEIIESTSTIYQVEDVLLTNKIFIKPHRSYIVNLDHIKNLSQDGFTMTNNQFIPVSRNVFKEVKQAYINHSFKDD